MKSFFFLTFVITLTFQTQAQAWDIGFPEEKPGPPRQYCVKPGWFNSLAYKCIDYAEAEKLGFDTDKIYGSAGSTSKYIQAQADIDKGKSDLSALERSLAGLQRDLAREKGRTGTVAELTAIQDRVKEIEGKIQTKQTEIDKARAALSVTEQTAGVTISEASFKAEVIRKGLLAQVNGMDTKLSSLESVLRNTEQELNGSILEAFVAAKIDKIAAGFCEASTMCANKDKEKEVKKFLMDKVTSEKLRSSIKPPAAAPAAPGDAATKR